MKSILKLFRIFAGDDFCALVKTGPKILLKVGLPTTQIKNEGIMHEKLLYDILDELKSILNKDFWYYLKVFLVDQRGENLRNDVAHGLLKLNRCTKEVTEALIHQLILLTAYSEIKGQKNS